MLVWLGVPVVRRTSTLRHTPFAVQVLYPNEVYATRTTLVEPAFRPWKPGFPPTCSPPPFPPQSLVKFLPLLRRRRRQTSNTVSHIARTSFIPLNWSLVRPPTMSTRKRKQDADAPEELQALPSDVSEDEEE